MKTFKNFLTSALVLLAAVLNTPAATIGAQVAAATPLTLVSNGQHRITSIVFMNTNATATANLWFYDSEANSTSKVLAATTSYAYVLATNSNTFTNSANIIITNTVIGYSNVATAVPASTNERYRLLTMVVPATEMLSVSDVGLIPSIGFTIYSTAAGVVNIAYTPVR